MTLKLPRLPTGWKDQPQLFERYWNDAMDAIESNINSIEAIPVIQAELLLVSGAADAANTAAAAANTAAATANAATVTNKSESSIVNSFIDQSSFTGALMSVTSLGVVTVQAHTRIYGDSTLNPSVAVAAGTIPTVGSTSASIIRIYYNDPTRAGGAVLYQYTIDPTAAPVQGGNLHSVGAVKVPATGSINGINVGPPGYIYF